MGESVKEKDESVKWRTNEVAYETRQLRDEVLSKHNVCVRSRQVWRFFASNFAVWLLKQGEGQAERAVLDRRENKNSG